MNEFIYMVKSRAYRIYNESQYENLMVPAVQIGFDIKKEDNLTKITLTGTKKQFAELKRRMG